MSTGVVENTTESSAMASEGPNDRVQSTVPLTRSLTTIDFLSTPRAIRIGLRSRAAFDAATERSWPTRATPWFTRECVVIREIVGKAIIVIMLNTTTTMSISIMVKPATALRCMIRRTFLPFP